MMIALAGLIPALSHHPDPETLPVLVACSDGAGCAVGPSSGKVFTVDVHWVHPQLPAQQPLGDDPGANL